MNTNELPMWVFAASTALAVVGGLLATRLRSAWLAALPLHHAAGAALVALFGWEVLVYLPGTAQVYFNTIAGIPNAPGVADQQAFLVASAVFAVATVLAMVGIVRLRPWGTVLGIGLAATRLATSVAAAVNMLSLAESMDPTNFGQLLWTTLSLNALPPLVAIGLLLWPLRRGPSTETPPVEIVEWSADASPEGGR